MPAPFSIQRILFKRIFWLYKLREFCPGKFEAYLFSLSLLHVFECFGKIAKMFNTSSYA